ncbi:MAG: 4'-phosphopantetheinyl transferase superfamily protein [Acidobacteriota bacterium]
MNTLTAVQQDFSPSPPKRLIVKDNDVHIWCASLDQDPSVLAELLSTLTADEREKAARFHFQKDRDHYIIARGALRDILGRYLVVSARQLRFLYTKFGKPSLEQKTNSEHLHFNLSHSHGTALYAVSKNREVGIDLEYIREDFASLEIAERFFSPDEVAMLRSLPANLRTRGFFNCWTRKEAYIKGLGEGLSHRLDSFTVSLIPGEQTSLHIGDDPNDVSHWALVPISFNHSYIAALAVEGTISTTHFWEWFPSFVTGET